MGKKYVHVFESNYIKQVHNKFCFKTIQVTNDGSIFQNHLAQRVRKYCFCS